MSFDSIFGIHEKALELRSHRSEVIAANLANSDTPGYKARDFDFSKVLQNEMPLANTIKTTHANHINPTAGPASGHMAFRVPDQASTDGNTVDVQKEQVEFSENALRYQASLRFLDGKIKGLNMAIKGRSQ